ncbi:MAG: dimethylargininase [Vulcanimicrobiota bacterium]
MARALLKSPSENFASGLTGQTLGPPDLALARAQHRAYQEALESLGLEIILLPADSLPDSCFVEDMAVVTPSLLVATRSQPRGAEQPPVLAALGQALPHLPLVAIQAPGALEGGDVLRMGNRWFVGRTARTNAAGIEQFRAALEPAGHRVEAVELGDLLHLKTGVSRLDERTVLALPQLADRFAALGYEVLPVHPEDWHAANTVAIGRNILLPAGHPRVVDSLIERGFAAVEVDLSEFKKQDGGASCLSILLDLP